MNVCPLKAPLEIGFDVTARCNLKCCHCYNSSSMAQTRREYTKSEITELGDSIITAHPYNVGFSGGEPLLRYDEVADMTSRCTLQGIRTSMFTNGWFVDGTVAQGLKTAGMQEVCVSLDGGTEETHDYIRGMKGSFQRGLKALRHLKEAGIPKLAISFTVMRPNAGEIGRTVDIAIDHGIDSILFRDIVPCGKATATLQEINLEPAERRKTFSVINGEIAFCRGKINIRYMDQLSHILIYRKRDYIEGLELCSDGHIQFSPYLPIRVGDIRKHSIAEYWDAGMPYIWHHPRIDEYLRTHCPNGNIGTDLPDLDVDILEEAKNA